MSAAAFSEIQSFFFKTGTTPQTLEWFFAGQDVFWKFERRL